MTRAPIAIIGKSCRLPGANTIDAFWRLLVERRCSVRAIDDRRWATHRFLHPRKAEPGKAYTFAAGVLDDIWSFDPTVFSISPREAEQMDPQQRLALQLVWEALEDAGIPPSKIARSETGVFVGASALDYGNRGIFDPAGIDAYFATGNTLSIVSNRISYAFDLRGPSFTVDTACSSSLVALHEAAVAIETGRIDTAVVVGVNILASPVSFVSFAQASMLSPQGLCRAFDAGADGYVRAEGGVAIVLRAERAARAAGNLVQARILGSGVNSDGRTVGMSFPSTDAQVALLRHVYEEASVGPDSLAFIEAHGTGTRVGDPAEATAVGRALASRRGKPLPIGSVKTNVGHLEPASGLVGLLKATLALEHNLLPASLHVETLNPDIPFDELNLRVASAPVPLTNGKAIRAAGINSFGFGGTNAHVIVADPEFELPARPEIAGLAPHTSPILALSARSPEALRALANAYGSLLAEKDAAAAAQIAASVAASRDLLSHRLVVESGDPRSWASRLTAASTGAADQVVVDTAIGKDVPVAFVYSGNGSQWAGMGRTLHAVDAVFREQFAEVDGRFSAAAGWTLRDALFADDLADRLRRAEIAQPLLFATQVATTAALRDRGVSPSVVFGHSVGEVAAAWAAGALDLDQAVDVIHSRSRHQEIAWNAGTMAAILLPFEETERLIVEGGFNEIEIAAVNSARSLTVSGPHDQIRAMAKLARARRVAMRVLELDYPFHTALIDGVRAPLASDLTGLTPRDSDTLFISTVTGDRLAGADLGAVYWWRNVRQRVRFADAMASAIRLGARVFVEIGPRPVLQNYVNDGLSVAEVVGGVLSCDDQGAPPDPVRRAVARVVAKGGAVDAARVFGNLRGRPDRLPAYPWQNRRFAVTPSVEMQDIFGLHRAGAHPLIGTRSRADGAEWLSHLDPGLVPYLVDHKVGGRIIVAAAALAEMALAAGRAWLDSPTVELQDFEILRPLILDPDVVTEVTTRISSESRTVEILSRPRLHDEPRTLHAFGRVSAIPTRRTPVAPAQGESLSSLDPPHLYSRALVHGLDFGPSFRGAERVETLADRRIRVTLKAQDASRLSSEGYGLYPPALDSCFHGLIQIFEETGTESQTGIAYLPVRFGEVRLYKPATPIRTALLTVKRASARSIQADFTVLDESGEVVATLADCRYRASALNRRAPFDRLAYHYTYQQLAPPLGALEATPSDARPAAAAAQHTSRHDDDLLLEAFAVSLAHEAVASVVGRRRQFTIEELIAGQRLAAQSAAIFRRLLGILHDQGAATVTGDRWHLPRRINRPSARDILRTVVTEHPARVAESVLGARAAAVWPRILRDGPAPESPYTAAMLLQFGGASPCARGPIDAVAAIVAEVAAEWPADRPLRILELAAGSGALTRRLARGASDARITILTTDPDAVAAERLRFAFGGHAAVRVERLDLAATDTATDFGRFDLVVSASPLGLAVTDSAAVQRLTRLVADGGRLVIAALAPSSFVDVVFGIESDWLKRSTAHGSPAGLLRAADDWAADLKHARFADVEVAPLADVSSPALLITASARRRSGRADSLENPQGHVVLVGAETRRGRQFADELTRRFEAAGRAVHLVDDDGRYGRNESYGPVWGDVPSLVVELTKPIGDQHTAATDVVEFACGNLDVDAAAGVAADVGKTLGLARGLSHSPARLWVILPGAFQGIVDGGRDRPAQAAHAGFLRVLANESPDLDLRVVDMDQDLDESQRAAELVRAVLNPVADREIAITPTGVRAPRLRRGLPPSSKAAGASHHVISRLVTGRDGGIDGLEWRHAAAREPGPGEVAIDIAATGLNFRDVMWALGLLPEEALEDGFAGPTLGIEGAGTVVSVGPDVHRVKPGDRVVTFASGAFTSRAVVPEIAVAPMPASLGFEAGATIPVAFLTAYYALHHLARLDRGEWLLVHGGAGGVGLAALQIAGWRGARIIATAGSEEKRDFLRMLGADHVLSSRSLDFADEVRALTGGLGVDVVLNSLAGEAMERSLQAIRPFGRFLELGKRDFYANSRIGLRPFRRNVSYFGIDADQLLAHRPALTARLFRDVVRLFEKGALSPLPYRAFASDDVHDAFRVMQQSSHVGKIVVAPPPVAEGTDRAAAAFSAAGDGTHLIVGGLGGFGLAAAAWLVERGARHLALVGRNGASSDEAKAAVGHLEQLGANVSVHACDAADAPALATTLAEIGRKMPPVRGVIHAAMVLDDGLIANLDEERFVAVLKPKVDGAANLDRLTRDASLDFFVLFSSATTVIGNPGQANYVAANAYLESLARSRRAAGLPALAVAWGAIEDVGYLARKTDVRHKVSRRLGQAGLTAREALDALGRLLAETDGGRRDAAAVVIAPMDWALARRELKLLASPIYAQVVSDAELSGAADAADRVDLVALVRGRDPQSARDAVTEILAGEVSRILKLPAKEIGPQRSLAELGMDSLMGLELRLGVERRFGIELPLPSISDVTTLATIAASIVARIQDVDAGDSVDPDHDTNAELARRHVADEVTLDDLAEIGEAVRSRRAEMERIL